MVARVELGEPRARDDSPPLRVDLWHSSLKQLFCNSAILQDIVETLIILIMKSTEPFYSGQLLTVIFQESINWVLGTVSSHKNNLCYVDGVSQGQCIKAYLPHTVINS